MKKALLICGLISGFTASAQLTVDDTLSTGDTFTYYVLDSNAVNLASETGASATWDYSGTAGYPGDPSKVNDIVDASSTAYASDFPSTAYAEDFEDGVVTFFSNVGTEVHVDGFVYNDGTETFVVKYDTDNLIALSFPMNQGDTYTDPIDGTATIPTVGDVDVAGEATVTADGTGSLITAGGTYPNVIRIHTNEYSEGSFFGQTIEITRESYWYFDLDNIATQPMPIFRHDNIIADLDAGGVYGFSAVFSIDPATSYVSVEENETSTLSVYPNPVNGIMNITLPEDASQVVVMNAAGQVIMTKDEPSTTETVDVSNFEAGIYLVKINTAEGVMTKKVTVK